MNRSGLLNWCSYRYARWSMVLLVVSLTLYITQYTNGSQPPNGGTWQGYTLGTIGLVLIVWLSSLGLRKRSYASTLGTVQGWSSAHIWLGTALLIIATLHSAAQLGWNIHSLAYVLMCLVILTGFYGLYAYTHFPARLADNSLGKVESVWLQELQEVDGSIGELATSCSAELQAIVRSATDIQRRNHTFWSSLLARDMAKIKLPNTKNLTANKNQQLAIEAISERIPVAHKPSEASAMNGLLTLFGRRAVLLARMRRHRQIAALLRVWLFFHVPLTFALLSALVAHIVSVFLYW